MVEEGEGQSRRGHCCIHPPIDDDYSKLDNHIVAVYCHLPW